MFDRAVMMTKIAATLAEGETLHITVTEARGRTLVQHYNLSRNSIRYAGQKWGGYGNLRAEYARRVLGR